MKTQYLKLFSVVFGISLLGSLPIGTLTASILHYTLKQDFRRALDFGIGAILIEALAVRISLVLFKYIQGLKRLIWVIFVLAFFIILFLAIKTLEAAYFRKDFQQVLPFLGGSAFFSGMFLSLINPLHIPFWSGWTLVLRDRKLLEFNSKSFNIYVLSLSLGTGFAFVLYCFLGNLILTFFKEGYQQINWIIGFTLLFTSFAIAYRIWSSPFPFKGNWIRRTV